MDTNTMQTKLAQIVALNASTEKQSNTLESMKNIRIDLIDQYKIEKKNLLATKSSIKELDAEKKRVRAEFKRDMKQLTALKEELLKSM